MGWVMGDDLKFNHTFLIFFNVFLPLKKRTSDEDIITLTNVSWICFK